MGKKVETILETFINNEIYSTEQRIEAIRAFVHTLRAELTAHAAKLPDDPSDKEYFLMVLKLFRSMINTYDEEITVLNLKRERMLEHLLNVRSVVAFLQPGDTPLNDLHIN